MKLTVERNSVTCILPHGSTVKTDDNPHAESTRTAGFPAPRVWVMGGVRSTCDLKFASPSDYLDHLSMAHNLEDNAMESAHLRDGFHFDSADVLKINIRDVSVEKR